ncbi:hypothetical protein B0H66DRAFT_468239 [Apodospora peruviana]|uniref:DNA mismatch repair protein S5 domain-containing protein n=1 Tax=Apodospora peruviana TaxID=516989 RepID=A0AAE0IS49_9PEZI|nr:hypothetical protein B0H66DRAFT_468239 [Apodospora peruviana]
MPITRLPEESVSELGSTLAIATPVALVKELIDNAIDAGATFVDVLVSANTLDRIKVRDNGHGICPDDFDALGRSGYTSKIRSFEEISTLGGSSLGFRGVALASAGAVAEVSLITRTAKDSVARTLCLSDQESRAKPGCCSAPVGTTVFVTRLFSRFPVRLKHTIKDAPANLLRMRELLQSYALARPRIKFQFRIFKDDKTSLSYSPSPHADIKDTAIQLFGPDLASNCMPKIFGSREHNDTHTHKHGETTSLVFEAFLPKPDADITNISRGAFFSVDSRPVSSTRKIFRKLYSSFKAHLARSILVLGSIEKTPKTPFIQLNIKCAPGSYDPNVEPSKDDVLFRDEKYILNQFEIFLDSVYPIPRVPLFRNQTAMPTLLSIEISPAGVVCESDDDDLDLPSRTGPMLVDGSIFHDLDEASTGDHLEGLNPWSIAKLAAKRGPAHPCFPVSDDFTHVSSQRPPSHAASWGAYNEDIQANQRRQPPPSQQSIHPRLNNDDTGGAYRKPVPSSLGHTNPAGQQTRNQHSQGYRKPLPSSSGVGDHDNRLDMVYLSPSDDGDSLGMIQTKIPFGEHWTEQQLPKSGNNRHYPTSTYSAPARHRGNGEGEDPTMSNRASVPKRPTNWPLLSWDTVWELERSLIGDFPFRNAGNSRPRSDAGPRDYRLATKTDGIPEQEETPAPLPTEDSRAYLIKRQRYISNNPMKRARRLKTDLLPLETTPRGFETQTLVLTTTIDPLALMQWMTKAARFDAYLADGDLEFGLTPDLREDEVNALMSRMRALQNEDAGSTS